MAITLDNLLSMTDRREIRRALGVVNLDQIRDREHGEGILLNAIRCRNNTLIAILLKKRIQVNVHGLSGVTPLMLASAEVSVWLIENGASVDAVDEEGRSALIYAVISADFDKVAYLVTQGADTQLRDTSGQTAADYAEELGFSLPVLK